MPRKDKGPAPVGDSVHSPKVKHVSVTPDPNGNRRERRAAAKEAKKQGKGK